MLLAHDWLANGKTDITPPTVAALCQVKLFWRVKVKFTVKNAVSNGPGAHVYILIVILTLTGTSGAALRLCASTETPRLLPFFNCVASSDSYTHMPTRRG